MKIIPKPYYVCDYCNTKSNKPNFKYDDNSGINNKTYDMCSDECRDKHIKYLKTELPNNEFEKHVKEWIIK